MGAIKNTSDFQAALAGKPSTRGALLAYRATLRVLPIALSQAFLPDRGYSGTRIGRLFWIAARLEAGAKILLRNPTRNALRAVLRVSMRSAREAESIGAQIKLGALQTANAMVNAATSLQGTAEFLEQAFAGDDARDYLDERDIGHSSKKLDSITELTAVSAARAAAIAAGAASHRGGAEAAATIWEAVSEDITFAEQAGEDHGLLALPLWQRAPEWSKEAWEDAKPRLDESASTFAFWGEWYQRRLEGQWLNFSLPSELAEGEINRRLIRMSDAWWSRPDERVNRDVASWLDELAGDLQEPSDEVLQQNPRALRFEPTSDERIGLSADRESSSDDFDDDAKDRHAEVLREAEAALAASSHGVTQATDLAAPLKDYMDAVGGRPEERRASLIILRGNKLRRLVDQRSDERSLAPPLSQQQGEALESLLAAHSLYVALDERLTEIEQASNHQETPAVIITGRNLHLVVETIERAELITEEAAETLRDAADNAAVPNKTQKQHSRFAGESVGNLIRVIGKIIKAGKAAGALGIAAVKAVGWVNSNNAVLSRIFAGSGWIRSILDWIAALKF